MNRDDAGGDDQPEQRHRAAQCPGQHRPRRHPEPAARRGRTRREGDRGDRPEQPLGEQVDGRAGGDATEHGDQPHLEGEQAGEPQVDEGPADRADPPQAALQRHQPERAVQHGPPLRLVGGVFVTGQRADRAQHPQPPEHPDRDAAEGVGGKYDQVDDPDLAGVGEAGRVGQHIGREQQHEQRAAEVRTGQRDDEQPPGPALEHCPRHVGRPVQPRPEPLDPRPDPHPPTSRIDLIRCAGARPWGLTGFGALLASILIRCPSRASALVLALRASARRTRWLRGAARFHSYSLPLAGARPWGASWLRGAARS